MAEEALKESERNYRSLVEEINDAILDLDEDYNVTYASPRTSHILGHDSCKILGKSLLDFIEDAGERKVIAEFFSGICTNGGSSELFECSVLNNAGKPVCLESSICPKYDEIGDLTGFRIVCRDITERKKAYRDLFRWKSFLNSIFENIPSMVMVKETKKGRYIFFNRASEEFFGIDRKKANGKMGCELFHDTITESLISGDSEVVRTGDSIEMPDLKINMPGKGERVLRVRKSPVKGPESTLEYIMTIADDITSLRKTEGEAIRQRDMAQGCLDVAGVMIAVIRGDGTVECLNKKGCEMTGYKEGEISGKDWFSLFVPENLRKASKKTFEDIISGKTVPSPDKIGTLMRRDGTEMEVIWQNTLLKDDDGNVTAMVSSASETALKG
ncbi:PAS domain-containing protein [Methanoplanus endosymbiosus]|uniref:PAS domain S-box protein n=1 Tax=Methanoplanus endosymbiosus TaxID=33865 RepID=A0A9E7TGK0_9EURY|nr:PAS domain S-box protein [Methanoplanus endosymbiosus]UUX91287.1 PAS domain S-box protein [Methanoplanus endosymbiosus]